MTRNSFEDSRERRRNLFRWRLKLEALESRHLLAFDLSSLNGTNGFTLEGIDGGIDGGDFSGHAVGGAGDINGDGLDDVIVGAFGADRNGVVDYSGEAYVVFGSTSSFPANFALSSLNGTNGFLIQGVSTGDYSGADVSFAGDVNGDGFHRWRV